MFLVKFQVLKCASVTLKEQSLSHARGHTASQINEKQRFCQEEKGGKGGGEI